MDILTVVVVLVGFILGYCVATLVQKTRFLLEKRSIRKEAIASSKAVLRGQIGEQLAPYLPRFPFKPSEIVFVGKPIDFVAFPGLDAGTPEEIVFVEVKTGNAQLSKRQEELKSLIHAKKVRWHEFRFP